MKALKNKIKIKNVIIDKRVFKFFPSAKVLKFEKKHGGLSDEDVLNLFVGLMNLVKNMATQKAENFYRDKINNCNKEINIKSQKLIKLQSEIKNLKNKI